MRQDARFGEPSAERLLGALPVVAGFCSRLKIRDIVDEACPVRDVAGLSHGQVIEALVANRLPSPVPLVHVGSWARAWSVGETLGIEPDLLNDDRIGRALDAIAPRLDRIVGSVGVAAIGSFGIDVTRLHWDMTSISMYGDYEQVEEGFADPRFGHPKDRRPDLKQVQAGIAVSGDGGVPVFHRAFDGGAGEVGQVVGVMKALQGLATPRRMLIIGDSKLISYANLAAMDADGVSFVAPASNTYVPVALLAGLSVAQASRADYVARRDAGKPADRRGSWHVVEDSMTLAGPRKRDPVLSLRRVFVHSSARAQARTCIGPLPSSCLPPGSGATTQVSRLFINQVPIAASKASLSASVNTRQIVVFDGGPAGAAPTRRYRSASTSTGTSARRPQRSPRLNPSPLNPSRPSPPMPPATGNDGRVITVRQLLQHTSGLPDILTYLSPQEILKDPLAHHDTRDLVNIALAHPPTFEPGTAWRYSNTNYLLAGMLIEKVTGHTYGAEIRRRILAPLGLGETYVPVDASTIPGPHPGGYVRPAEDAPLMDITAINPSIAGPSGAMISSGTDVNRFLDALVGGRLLRPAQLREMMKTRPTGNPDGRAYGLGLESRPLPCGGLYWGHGGDIFGYETADGATVDGRQATVMVNLDPGGSDA